MRSPRAASAGPVAAGATTSIKLGSAITVTIPQTGPAAQQIGRPRLTLAGDAADRAARVLAERRPAAAMTAVAWPTLPAAPPPPPTPMPPTPAETKPPPEATPPTEAKRTRSVHQPADPETVAWNRAREAEWLAARAEADARAAAEVDALEARLNVLAPLVFIDPPVPLAIGIDRDITARLTGETNTATLSRFLHRWTRRAGYLHAIARGDQRRDLDGQPVGEPTPDQREAAVRWLASQRREVVP
jgi:hypothetical protein